MNDIESYVQIAQIFSPLRDAMVRSAIQTLDLSPGTHGLDAGCGIGLQAIQLAKAVGPGGHVTGLDLSADLLLHAASIVRETGLSERLSFKEGDVHDLPFADDSFDWVWSMDCVGYMPAEPLPLIQELARVVRPGGKVAILAWSSEKLLPGYPLLEARLGATAPGIAPFKRGLEPDSHFLRALSWFKAAGLQRPQAHTFVSDVYAPLADDQRRALEALFQMRWSGAQEALAAEDRLAFQRLCWPESPEFLPNQPDYYAFFTYSMFSGLVGL